MARENSRAEPFGMRGAPTGQNTKVGSVRGDGNEAL